jgi:hypothetical protein
MNVHIDVDKIVNDIENNHSEPLNIMNYLYHYLDNGWNIKKGVNTYILTKNNHIMFISDSIQLFTATSSCALSGTYSSNNTTNPNNNKYILYFLYNVLNNGWKIKKTRNEEYIFIKKHEGKKEFFSNKYLHTFMKENFNYQLIK